jgi:hypothetical protein
LWLKRKERPDPERVEWIGLPPSILLGCCGLQFANALLVRDTAIDKCALRAFPLEFLPGTALCNDHPERDGIMVNFEMNHPERGVSLHFSILSIAVTYLEEQYRRSQPLQNIFLKVNFWRVLI